MNEKMLELFSFLSRIEQSVQIRRKVLTDYYDYDPAKIFKRLDIENKGYITSEDIILFLSEHNIPYTDESVKLMILFYDMDFNGILSFPEFVSIIQNNNILLNKKKINLNLNNNKLSFNIEYCLTKIFEKEIELNQYIINILTEINKNINCNLLDIFKELSLNKDYISNRDIMNYLNNNQIDYSKSQINDIMKRLDINKDGKIDFNEFKYLFELTNNNKNRINFIRMNPYYNSNNFINNNNTYENNIYHNSGDLNEVNNINNNINDNNIEEGNIRINNNYHNEYYLNNNIKEIDNNNIIGINRLYQTQNPIENQNYEYNMNSATSPCCDCYLNHIQINDNNDNRYDNYSIKSFNNTEQDKYNKYNNNIIKNIEPYDAYYDVQNNNNNEINNNYISNNEENIINNYDNNIYNKNNYNINYEEFCGNYNNKDYIDNNYNCNYSNYNNNNNDYINNYNQINIYENNSNNSPIVSPEDKHISNSLSLRSSPLRKNPPNKNFNDINSIRSIYTNYNKDFSPYFSEQKNYDIMNQSNIENSESNNNNNNNYHRPLKRNRSEGNFIINKNNIFNKDFNSNNLFKKDKNILSKYFKLVMDGESQIELSKLNLVSRKDFNLINAFNLFDEQNKGYISFDDLKNELEFIGLTINDRDIQLLINRFNKNNKKTNIEYNNFCNGLLPYNSENKNKYNEKIFDKNNINVFSPTTRLYLKALINNMIDLENKLNKYKKDNIDIVNNNVIEILKEIDFNEKGNINIKEFIKFLKENDSYSSLKEVELLFSRYDKSKRNNITYDDIISDLNYI